ncbi:hypothetical protein D3C81_2133820 [compost metagenome]
MGGDIRLATGDGKTVFTKRPLAVTSNQLSNRLEEECPAVVNPLGILLPFVGNRYAQRERPSRLVVSG